MASSVYRKLFISRVGAAVAAVQPDALHLDTSSWMLNDGNGPIEGMSYAQGGIPTHLAEVSERVTWGSAARCSRPPRPASQWP